MLVYYLCYLIYFIQQTVGERMSLLSTTETKQSQGPLVVTLYSDSSLASHYSSALLQLKDILKRFHAENDDLSVSLYNWGVEAISLKVTTAQEFIKKTQDLIDDLQYSILGNPFGLTERPALCEEPLYDGEWIWSKPTYEKRLQFSPLSPFTKRPFDAKPHPFARAMVDWVRALPLMPREEVSESQDLALVTIQLGALQISDTTQNPQIAMAQELLWQTVVRGARHARDSFRERRVIKVITDEAKRALEVTRANLRQEIETLRQERITHHHRVMQLHESTTKTHKATTDILHARIDDKNQELGRANVQLAEQKDEITSLKARASALEQQIRQQADQLQRMQGGGGGGFCAIL